MSSVTTLDEARLTRSMRPRAGIHAPVPFGEHDVIQAYTPLVRRIARRTARSVPASIAFEAPSSIRLRPVSGTGDQGRHAGCPAGVWLPFRAVWS